MMCECHVSKNIQCHTSKVKPGERGVKQNGPVISNSSQVLQDESDVIISGLGRTECNLTKTKTAFREDIVVIN